MNVQTALAFTFLLSSSAAANLFAFFDEVAASFEVSSPTLVINTADGNLNPELPSEINAQSSFPWSFLYYSDSEVAAQTALIEDMFRNSDLEMLVFLEGRHEQLLLSLDKAFSLVSSQVSVLMDSSHLLSLSGLSLRLNSRLYGYEIQADGKIKLDEFYAIKSGPRISQNVGTWTKEDGFQIKIKNIWERRSNMKLAKLVSTVVDFPPVFMTTQSDGETGPVTSFSGEFGDIVKTLQTKLNFTLEMVCSADGKYGGYDKATDSWNGMVRMLMDGKADMINTAFSHTKVRSAVVDFSIPLGQDIDTLTMAVTKGSAVNFWVYMDVFPHIVWAVIAAMLIFSAGILLAIDRSPMGPLHDKSDSERFGFLNGFATAALFLMQLDYPSVARTAEVAASTKIALFVIGASAYLIFAYFSADLTAKMTHKPAGVPIRSFDDLLDTDYQVVTLESSQNHNHLLNAKNGTAMRRVYRETMHGRQKAFVNDIPEARQRLSADPTVLYFGSEATFADDPGFVALRLDDQVEGYWGFGFRKNSELTEFMNYHLFKMEESGILKKIKDKWFEKIAAVSQDDQDLSLGYENVLYPFNLVLGGIALASIASACELCWKKWKRSRVKLLPS